MNTQKTTPPAALPAPGLASASQLMRDWGLPVDPELLVLALTHRSFAHEHGNIPTNERLEFLGDAVLQLVVTEWLYRHFPDEPEGNLAKMRSATVSQPALAVVARQINLGDYILLGRGEAKTKGRNKDSILSDTMEALIGATYLGHGLEPTRTVIEKQLGALLKQAQVRGAGMDWKTSLQVIINQNELSDLRYEVNGKGPDHARIFTAKVWVGEKCWGEGTASSKKLAEHYAAREAAAAICADLGITPPAGLEAGSDPKTPRQK